MTLQDQNRLRPPRRAERAVVVVVILISSLCLTSCASVYRSVNGCEPIHAGENDLGTDCHAVL